MEGEVIKSFLVGLGFGVDDSSLAKFNKSIATAALRVTALYGTIQVAASAIGYGITKISDDFEKMGYDFHIIAPQINKALLLRRELLKAYSAAGINITKVVKESLKLNLSLTKTKFALEAIYKSVGSRFFELLTKQSDLFRQRIYANMPKIMGVLERVIKFIFKAFEATTLLGLRLWSILERVYGFFVKLDKATSGWSTIVLGLIAAWKLLNLSFLATPLGMIIAGLVTILALFDDFKTFQEGGESLFNWTPFIPVIDAVVNSLKSMWAVLQAVADVVANVALTFYQLFQGDGTGVFDSLKNAGQAILDIFTRIWDVMKGIASLHFAAFEWAAGVANNFVGNSNAAQNIQNAPKGIPSVSPLGAQGVSNSQNNQNVNQQTQINITGVPDANATAKAVSGEQNKVNFDLVRNLKGAVKPGGILSK